MLYIACGTKDIPSNWFAPLVEEISKINPIKSLSQLENKDSSLLPVNNEVHTVMLSPEMDEKDLEVNNNETIEEINDNEDCNRDKTEILSKLDSIFNEIKSKTENNEMIYNAEEIHKNL